MDTRTDIQRAFEQIKSNNPVEQSLGALTLMAHIIQNSEGWDVADLEQLCKEAVDLIGDEIKGSGFWLISWPAFWFDMGMTFGHRFNSVKELLNAAIGEGRKIFFISKDIKGDEKTKGNS